MQRLSDEEVNVSYDSWLMEPYEYPELYDFSTGQAVRDVGDDQCEIIDPYWSCMDEYPDDFED